MKRLGAHVTAVDRGTKLEFMRALGADEVIDFEREDFAKRAARYDLVVDVQALRPVFTHLRVLRPGGRYVIVGGTMGRIFATVMLGSLVSAASGRGIGLLFYRPNVGDLDEMARLFSAGEVVPKVEAVYPLEWVGEALRHVGEGRAMGKVVVEIA